MRTVKVQLCFDLQLILFSGDSFEDCTVPAVLRDAEDDDGCVVKVKNIT
jgi:hypothetical protein